MKRDLMNNCVDGIVKRIFEWLPKILSHFMKIKSAFTQSIVSELKELIFSKTRNFYFSLKVSM